MNLPELKKIATTLDREIAEVLARHGLKMGKRTASVDPLTGAVRWTMTVSDINQKDAQGNATTPEAERWKQYAPMLRLPVDAVGRQITRHGKTFKIVGLADTRSPAVVVMQNVGSGKVARYYPDDVRHLLTA